MNIKVAVPKTLRWRCSWLEHAAIVETANPARPPICCVPVSDWVCSVEMITVEDYERRQRKTN